MQLRSHIMKWIEQAIQLPFISVSCISFLLQSSFLLKETRISLNNVAEQIFSSHVGELLGKKLSWIQRIGAATGVVKGVQFLHTGIVPGVFQNDIKITDVLLDHNLLTKISKYNLPLLSEDQGLVGNNLYLSFVVSINILLLEQCSHSLSCSWVLEFHDPVQREAHTQGKHLNFSINIKSIRICWHSLLR